LYEFVQKKDLHPGWDLNPGPIWLAIVAAARHPQPHLLRECPFYLYTIQ
jgi:hypothetical protein